MLHSPILGICFVCRLLLWQDYVYFIIIIIIMFGTAMSIKKVFIVFLSIKVMPGWFKGTVLPVSMLWFQYSLKMSFSRTMADMHL